MGSTKSKDINWLNPLGKWDKINREVGNRVGQGKLHLEGINFGAGCPEVAVFVLPLERSVPPTRMRASSHATTAVDVGDHRGQSGQQQASGLAGITRVDALVKRSDL